MPCELVDSLCKQNLTAEEYERAAKGYKQRLELESKIFFDPDVVAQDRLVKVTVAKLVFQATGGAYGLSD